MDTMTGHETQTLRALETDIERLERAETRHARSHRRERATAAAAITMLVAAVALSAPAEPVRVTHDFAGDKNGPLSSTKMDTNFADLEPLVMPTGAVVFFEGTECPTGWTELTAARGRAVVGLRSGGTVKGTVGTPLTDLEDREHYHAVVLEGAGSHNHRWANLSSNQEWDSWNVDGNRVEMTDYTDGFHLDGSGEYPLTRSSTGSINFHSSDNLAVPVVPGFSENHTHTTAVDDSAGLTSNVMPYIQRLVCEKD